MNVATEFPAISTVREVAKKLGDLRGECLFVGGACVGFYLTDPIARAPRVTMDVDVVVEVSTQVQYADYETRMRLLGFEPDMDSGVICRHRQGNLIVDLMPTIPAILGFSNRWYPQAITAAEWIEIENGLHIRIATPGCFLATKIEAFIGRGGGDFAASQDFEDIVLILDFRPSIVGDCESEPEDVRTFIQDMFRNWLAKPSFLESIAQHLMPDTVSQGRREIVVDRMIKIVGSIGPQ